MWRLKLVLLSVVVVCCVAAPLIARGGKNDAAEGGPCPVGERSLRRIDARDAFERRIMAAMRKKMSIELDDKPLAVFAEKVSRELSIPVEVDSRSMTDAGEPLEGSLGSISLGDVTVFSVMQRAGSTWEMDWYLGDGKIILDFDYSTRNRMETRLYDVTDLVDVDLARRWKPPKPPEPKTDRPDGAGAGDTSSQQVPPGVQAQMGEFICGGYVPILPGQYMPPRWKHTTAQLDKVQDMLLDFTNINGREWHDYGGKEGADIVMMPGKEKCLLAVTHSIQGQNEVAWFLSQLRSVRRGPKPDVPKLDFIDTGPSAGVMAKLDKRGRPYRFKKGTHPREVMAAIARRTSLNVVGESLPFPVKEKPRAESDATVVPDPFGSDAPAESDSSGAGSEHKLKTDVSGDTAREILDKIFGYDAGYSWDVRENVVIVSNEPRFHTRVFDITPLLARPGKVVYGKDIRLAEMIRSAVAVPEPGWAADGGMEYAELQEFHAPGIHALVVCQTRDGMRQVEDFLARMHRGGVKLKEFNVEPECRPLVGGLPVVGGRPGL